jgi:uncharacterized protein YkwD
MLKPEDFAKLTKETFEMLNKARTDPAWVAAELQKYRNFYKNKEYKNPALGFTFETQEGVKAVEDAIDFLKKKVYPQKPLGHSSKLDSAAKTLLSHFDQTGGTSAAGEEFSLQNRLKKELGTVKSMAESSSFGFHDPKEIVFQLIIDDGVATRANRKNLYSPSFTEAGLALGTHKDYGYACIIDFHGDGKKEEKQMEKYHLPKNEWPMGAISLQTHLEMKADGVKRIVKATYSFTLPSGETEIKTKEFIEDL